MIKGIGHLGVFVASIENSLAALEKLVEFERPTIREFPEMNFRCAVIRLGAAEIELLQETKADGGLARLCREKGDFIHHFSLLTDTIEKDVETWKQRGVEMMDAKPRIGLRGKAIAMSMPSAFNGIAVELSEP